MNYYIQGDAENADKIKAAFEAKGCVMHTGIQCDLSDMIYYSLNGKVGSIKLRNLDLFKTHPDYKELELPTKPKFKVGDWITDGTFTHYIVSIVDGFYYFYGGGYLDFGKIDGYYHLWTIQDAKDGDVLVTTKIRSCPFIYCKPCCDDGCAYYYVGLDGRGNLSIGCFRKTPELYLGLIEDAIPATKEQRDLLFKKIKEAGYEWDADKKELRKIQPHYDINNFHAGMPVLVRETSLNVWQYVLFSHCYVGGDGLTRFNAGLVGFNQCIPFNDDTKHLLGTTDPCDEQYINW